MGVPLYGDPEELDRLAARLQLLAAVVRQHAADHQRQGEVTHWVSVAAQACRERVATDRADADRAAVAMEHAAAALRAHAQKVRETIALIARFEREVSDWFERESRSLLNRAEGVVDSAGRALHRLVEDPPWRTWPIAPDALPASGDVEWLEVGRFMRRQGAI